MKSLLVTLAILLSLATAAQAGPNRTFRICGDPVGPYMTDQDLQMLGLEARALTAPVYVKNMRSRHGWIGGGWIPTHDRFGNQVYLVGTVVNGQFVATRVRNCRNEITATPLGPKVPQQPTTWSIPAQTTAAPPAGVTVTVNNLAPAPLATTYTQQGTGMSQTVYGPGLGLQWYPVQSPSNISVSATAPTYMVGPNVSVTGPTITNTNVNTNTNINQNNNQNVIPIGIGR